MTITITRRLPDGRQVAQQMQIEVTVPANALPSVQNAVAQIQAGLRAQIENQRAVDQGQDANLEAHQKDIDALKKRVQDIDALKKKVPQEP
jgi:hypothetical protein